MVKCKHIYFSLNPTTLKPYWLCTKDSFALPEKTRFHPLHSSSCGNSHHSNSAKAAENELQLKTKTQLSVSQDYCTPGTSAEGCAPAQNPALFVCKLNLSLREPPRANRLLRRLEQWNPPDTGSGQHTLHPFRDTVKAGALLIVQYLCRNPHSKRD